MMPFKFTTDTSTLCIFDLEALRHRIDDDPDWWVYPESVQVQELNAGNAAFIDLGGDGTYAGSLSEGQVDGEQFSFILGCSGGKVFIGAGEEATSDGMEPDCTRGGLMLRLERGIYRFSVALSRDRVLRIGLQVTQEQARNNFTSALRLAATGT